MPDDLGSIPGPMVEEDNQLWKLSFDLQMEAMA